MLITSKDVLYPDFFVCVSMNMCICMHALMLFPVKMCNSFSEKYFTHIFRQQTCISKTKMAPGIFLY